MKNTRKAIYILTTLLLANGLALAVTMSNGTLDLFDYGNWEEMPREDAPNSNVNALITAVADFNQDGFDDVVTYNSQYHLSQIYLNQSGKGFTLNFNCSPNTGCTSFGANNIKIADVNGDGFPDIMSGGASTDGGFSVLINQLGPAYSCVTDLDADGDTSVGDLLFVLEEWGPCN